MTNRDIYNQLVDLYAGRELPTELEEELEAASKSDSSLRQQMLSLRKTVDALQDQPAPEFTEESYQRILLKIYSRGVDIQKRSPDPIHLQYQLPIQG